MRIHQLERLAFQNTNDRMGISYTRRRRVVRSPLKRRSLNENAERNEVSCCACDRHRGELPLLSVGVGVAVAVGVDASVGVGRQWSALHS